MLYLTRKISPDDLQHITEGNTACWTYFPPDAPQDRFLREGLLAANRQQTDRDVAQAELADWIRWSDGEAKDKRDGLTPEGMEINGFAGWYVRHFFSRNEVLTTGFKEKGLAQVAEQVNRHGGWLVLTSQDSSVAELLESGRRFQRMFLRVRDRNIAVHPMTQMLEEAPWKDLVAAELGVAGPVQFILRVGYLERYPDPVTLRRPASRFTAQ